MERILLVWLKEYGVDKKDVAWTRGGGKLIGQNKNGVQI